MGMAKRMMEMYEERGYGTSEKIVCHECVGDYYLKDYIKHNGSKDKCDYCGMNRKCVELENLMEPIMAGISSEYEDANDCMSWDSREGGFQGAETWDSYDLIHDELWNELDIENSDLLNDIADILEDITWCPKNPYSSREHDEDYYTWKSFSTQLKNNIRYVFFMTASEEESYERYSKPSDILTTIGNSISNIDLYETIKMNTPLFRGRMHSKADVIDCAKTLGAPPPLKARSSRMNPEGISMFYAAFDELTALTEIYDSRKHQATVGIFYNQKELNVINLSKIPQIKIPSMFEIENRGSRTSLLFLKKFYSEITSKVDDDELLEYIPTQVMTEYFRHVFRTVDGERIDGLIYSSSIRKNGKCIVLFIDNNECSDDKNKRLWLDKDSIRHIAVSSIKLEL